jgi:hypothetical protein
MVIFQLLWNAVVGSELVRNPLPPGFAWGARRRARQAIVLGCERPCLRCNHCVAFGWLPWRYQVHLAIANQICPTHFL